MANAQNLRPPWPKGQSGNPDGHSKSRRDAGAMVQRINDSLDDPQSLRTISETWLAEILAGNFQYFKYFLDRKDGRVKPR